MTVNAWSKCMIQMFTDRGWNFGKNADRRIMTAAAALTHVRFVVDLTLPAILWILSDKVKQLALILLKVSLAHQDFILCRETSCILFSYNYLMKCLYSIIIVNPLLQQNFCWRPHYIAVGKEYVTNRQIIFRRLESAFSQMYLQKFLF